MKFKCVVKIYVQRLLWVGNVEAENLKSLCFHYCCEKSGDFLFVYALDIEAIFLPFCVLQLSIKASILDVIFDLYKTRGVVLDLRQWWTSRVKFYSLSTLTGNLGMNFCMKYFPIGWGNFSPYASWLRLPWLCWFCTSEPLS